MYFGRNWSNEIVIQSRTNDDLELDKQIKLDWIRLFADCFNKQSDFPKHKA